MDQDQTRTNSAGIFSRKSFVYLATLVHFSFRFEFHLQRALNTVQICSKCNTEGGFQITLRQTAF